MFYIICALRPNFARCTNFSWDSIDATILRWKVTKTFQYFCGALRHSSIELLLILLRSANKNVRTLHTRQHSFSMVQKSSRWHKTSNCQIMSMDCYTLLCSFYSFVYILRNSKIFDLDVLSYCFYIDTICRYNP